tara:strand:+ start:196 stop:570 length:375 start_codon:yes stop_codon:yes gene_type:complete
MSDPVWPESLPCRPVLRGTSMKPQDNRARFKPEVGPPISRRRGTAAGALHVMSFLMTSAQLATFQSFFADDLLSGSLAFTGLKNPLTKVAARWKFSDDPYEVSELVPGRYTVGMNLFEMPTGAA